MMKFNYKNVQKCEIIKLIAKPHNNELLNLKYFSFERIKKIPDAVISVRDSLKE